MNHDQIQQEISIIKTMIEKTKKQTAESGRLFIFMGIAAALFVIVISMLEIYHLQRWVLPMMIALTVVNGVLGFLIVGRAVQKEKVTTYPRTVVLNLWVICSVALLMLTFLFPFLKVYQFNALPILVSLIFGIGVFMTGIIYELRFIQWFSSVWWIGALLMALIQSRYRFLIMIASIIFGWIIPGFILNKQYKKGSQENES